ncbi:MAG TPA: hypothetical protein DCS97_07505 [Planctomycetes bacterium]|nr:hypothetical protein [Planctomycetota bacterium]
MLAQPRHADLAGPDPAHLAVGDAEALGQFERGEFAERGQPGRLIDRRCGFEIERLPTLPILT